MQIYFLFWAKGNNEKHAHDALSAFRLTGVPGKGVAPG
jgi:hypothetical protein